MSRSDLISKKTRTEFREFLVGSSLREIDDEFKAAGLEADLSFNPQVGGERRTYIEQFYHTLDFSDATDVQRLLQVYENVLAGAERRLAHPEDFPGDPTRLRRAVGDLVAWLKKDGYDFVGGRLAPTGSAATLKHLKAKASEFNAEYLAMQVDRLQAAVLTDPDLAIGQAKELVETCCKTILTEHGVADFDKLDVQPLVRKTAEALKLLPDDIDESAKGAKTIKGVLGNLSVIAQGLAELRNLYGTGHGKHGKTKRLSPRHARLAVGAATTLVTFLFETHSERTAAEVKA